MVKGLHRMPVADCGDYEEIPVESFEPGSRLAYGRGLKQKRTTNAK